MKNGMRMNKSGDFYISNVVQLVLFFTFYIFIDFLEELGLFIGKNRFFSG
jgi:hypothetical protein